MKGENGMTEAQKKAVEVQKEIEEACIRHGLNLTIFENGIGFVDPKENKIVMVWRPQYKPETPSLHPMEETASADFKPTTQKPSGGNMAAFIYGNPKGGGRFVGNRKKHTIRGMKKR
jgi:hypothetical protein